MPPIPDNIPLSEFMLTDLYGRNPLGYSRDPFTCGITGKSYSALEVVDRVDYLSRALSKELNWKPNTGTEWDKTLAIFSLNTVSFKPRSLQRPGLPDFRLRSIPCHCHGPSTSWGDWSPRPTQPTQLLSSSISCSIPRPRLCSPVSLFCRPLSRLHPSLGCPRIAYTCWKSRRNSPPESRLQHNSRLSHNSLKRESRSPKSRD